jgi:hypothetical protein
VLDGDPLADVRVLSDVRNLLLVMQGGKGVSGSLMQQMRYESLENVSFVTVRPSKRSW